MFKRRLDVITGFAPREGQADNLSLSSWVAVTTLLTGAIASFINIPVWITGTLVSVGMVALTMRMRNRSDVLTRALTRRETVTVTEKGITMLAVPFIPASAIAEAYYQPRIDGNGSVRCIDKKSEVLFECEVNDEEEAKEFLAALGRSATQKRARFRITSPLQTTALRGALAGVLIVGGLIVLLKTLAQGGWLNAALAIPLMFLFWVLARHGDAVIGTDGLFLEWTGRKRFIRFDEMASVQADGAHVKIELKTGKIARVGLVARSNVAEERLQRDAFIARLEEAFAASNEVEARDLHVKIARGDRAITEWRQALTRLSEAGAYREPPPREEDLWRVVEDARAPEDARAAAAVMLRQSPDPSRLRIAAEAVASPKLRIALETAATGNEEELDAALDELTATKKQEATKT